MRYYFFKGLLYLILISLLSCGNKSSTESGGQPESAEDWMSEKEIVSLFKNKTMVFEVNFDLAYPFPERLTQAEKDAIPTHNQKAIRMHMVSSTYINGASTTFMARFSFWCTYDNTNPNPTTYSVSVNRELATGFSNSLFLFPSSASGPSGSTSNKCLWKDGSDIASLIGSSEIKIAKNGDLGYIIRFVLAGEIILENQSGYFL